MNSNGQHPNDDIIERELVALREPAPSENSMGNAVLAMRATPSRARLSLKWPVGIGAAAVAGVLTVLIISATPRQAIAGELTLIANAQADEPLKYQKTTIFGGQKEPMRTMELWLHGAQEAFREYDDKGKLVVATTADRKNRYHYFTGTDLVRAAASKDIDYGTHWTIESIDSLLESEFFKKRKIEKKSNVMLNGKSCDYYDFANGYYRVWVDPVTKLPLQREVYDKGVTLWSRDVYSYPKAFADDTFTPLKPAGMTYFDYPDGRSRLEAELHAVGQTQKVGNVSITLKAVVTDPSSVSPIWTTTGATVPERVQSSVEIHAARPGYSDLKGLSALGSVSGLGLQAERLYYAPQGGPITVKIAAWAEDAQAPNGVKLLGWATFQVPSTFSCPDSGKLLVRPEMVIGTATAVKSDGQ